uniref:Peptidase M10 metallopeptidase domain-containing protein n=1 Tax=uncultured Elusimicrobia bacterium TaxID=699876 RepID=A0A650EM78_9BACT|nr:hypothetical protein Elusimicrob2101_0160 [uncultured Elusimicrobia bacterium]
MKKLLSLVCLWAAAGAFASPWGAMIDYDLAPAQPGVKIFDREHSSVSKTPGERFLLKPVLEGRIIRVFLNPGMEEEETLAVYRKKIQAAYSAWFSNAAKVIRQSKREAEFADILPLLDKGASVTFVEENEDITFLFVDRREITELCGSFSVACYSRLGAGPVIFIPKNPRGSRSFLNPFGASSGDVLSSAIVHEIGHSLGFSDQYAQSREATHEVYHGKIKNSVMNSSLKLTCDDADGMVNLIDITLNNRRGGMTGWRSLCRGSKTYYIGGMALGNGPYVFIPRFQNNGTVWVIRRYQNGKMTEETTFARETRDGFAPWENSPEQVLERDAVGRPVLARGADGTTVYYSYLYGRTLRLATADGKVLLLERWDKNLSNEKQFERRIVEFSNNGRPVVLQVDKRGADGSVFYQETRGGNIISLQMDFKKGKRIRARRNGREMGASAGPLAAGAGMSSLGKQIRAGVSKGMQENEWEKLEKVLQEWYSRL